MAKKQGGVVARLRDAFCSGYQSVKTILTTTLKVSFVLFPSTFLEVPHPAVVQMSSFPAKSTSHDTERFGAWPTTKEEAESTVEARQKIFNDVLCGYKAGDRHRNRNQLQALY